MYLVTGAAGFIGFHLSKELLEKNESVIGIDNINDYYDQKIKHSRLKILKKFPKLFNVCKFFKNVCKIVKNVQYCARCTK